MREQKIFSFYCAMTGIVKLLSHLVLCFPWGVEDSSPHNSCVWLAQRGAASAQCSAPVSTKVPVIWGQLWSHWRNESLSVGAAAPLACSQHCHCHRSSPHVPSAQGGKQVFGLPVRSAFTVMSAQQWHIGKVGKLRNRLLRVALLVVKQETVV